MVAEEFLFLSARRRAYIITTFHSLLINFLLSQPPEAIHHLTARAYIRVVIFTVFIIIVSEALFCTGVTALFRDPFWGGLSLVPLITFIQVCLLSFVDYLIVGVRKHGKHLKGILFYQKFRNINNKYLGGIEWQQRQNTTYTYISEW